MRAVMLDGDHVGVRRQHTDMAQYRDDRDDQQGGRYESVCSVAKPHTQRESTDDVPSCQRKPSDLPYVKPYPQP